MNSFKFSVRNIFLGVLFLFFGSSCLIPSAFADSVPAVDSYAQGMTLFQAKDYTGALPWFAKAVQEQPNSAKAYYCLGYCQLMTGDKKDAVLNFYISNDKMSFPSLKTYADKLKATMAPADQNWLDNELLSESAPPPVPQSALSASVVCSQPTLAPVKKSVGGFRIDASLLFFNLNDFNTILASMQYYAGVYQASQPSITFSGSVPSTGVAPELDPYLALDDSLELGLSFSYLLVNPVTYNYDSPSLNYFNHWTYSLDAWDFGMNLRWYPLKSEDKAVGFYLEPGVGFMPVDLTFEQNYQNAAYSVHTDDYGAYTGSTVIAPSIKAGMVVNLNKNVSISFSGGYQYAQASNFTGTYWDKSGYLLDGTPGTLEIYKSPTTGQSQTIFVPSSSSLYPNFGDTPTVLNNSRPLIVDLSGFRGAFDVSFLF